MKASNIPLHRIDPDDSEWDGSESEQCDPQDFLRCEPQMTRNAQDQMPVDKTTGSDADAIKERPKNQRSVKKVTQKATATRKISKETDEMDIEEVGVSKQQSMGK